MVELMKKNVQNEFETISKLWSPKIISEVNDVYVKLAKIHGDFDRHTHLEEDELFYVIKGSVTIIYDDSKVVLNEGDIHVVPKGAPHKPLALEECWVLLIENKSTKHTGEIINKYTKSIEQQFKQK
jgi:mannose-6-phosphate isomerase-like protein (cupin superfamily)